MRWEWRYNTPQHKPTTPPLHLQAPSLIDLLLFSTLPVQIIMSTTAKNFDISQLPSLKGKNAMTVEQEIMTRRKTCRFIEEAGRQLKFHRIAISTAEVFFHRFYAKHSFSDHERFEVAVAAILLAGKTEETPRKLNTGENNP